MEPLCSIVWASPAGRLKITGTGSRIHAVSFCDDSEPDGDSAVPGLLLHCRAQLEAYFEHRLTAFDLPLHQQGSPFELAVWKALQQIPYGRTCSYAQVAAMTGNPRASRAVGNACRKNPLAIVVPCHRVTGKKDLTGYRYGRERKEFLIRHEAENPLP